jgi:hypothetical protein
MGETTRQIETHIEHKRGDLQSNLQELEHKVKSATDWRHYFEQHTATMIAAAFGGGILISALAGKGGRAQAPSAPTSSLPSARAGEPGTGTNEILETWDTIKTALVGVAATKFKGMLSEVVPGFSAHLNDAEAKRHPTPTGRPSAIID